MESLNNDNLSLIESLRIRNEDYRDAIDRKNEAISQLEKVRFYICRTNKFSLKSTSKKTSSTT